jgi:serine/threonine-protein kinase
MPSADPSALSASLRAALAGRYRIDRELGAGGMATVWLAHDEKHGRDVAIKVIHPDLGAALGGERFLAEIRTTAKLQHPHILPLLDSGDAGDGLLYYVMPFMRGETLRDRLERERQLPVDDAVRIAREVAGALAHAHAQGVIHRDIKPENILLQDGNALVADFGIALAVQQSAGERMTQTGLSLGTPSYMSPEQAMGERTLDARSDVYALGAVTYEMLAGEPPFTGPTVQAIVARLIAEAPRPLTVQRRAIPPGVEHAVLRALEKLPADRFATAQAFAEALRADAPVTAMRSADVGRPPARRAPLVAAALVSIASLGVAAWALARGAQASGAPALFDAALPDSAPLSPVATVAGTGFGTPATNFSIAPDGSFLVFTVQRGDTTTLWYRSLVDATARPLEGTKGGTMPRISPDGTRLVFYAWGRLLVMPLAGGEPRRLLEGEPPATIEWVSPTRLMVLTSDGYTLDWVDAEAGLVEQRDFARNGTRCVFGQWLAASARLLCSFNEIATLLDPVTGRFVPLRVRGTDGAPGVLVNGASFRMHDGGYITWVAIDGTLRAARFDEETQLVGRAVTVVAGVKRDPIGAAQLVLAADGLLGFAPTTSEADGELVVLAAGASAPVALPVERATYLRFDLAPDRRTLAAVVQTPEAQELRIHDLRTGRRQVWLRAERVGQPLWTPGSDRLVVRVESGDRGAFLLGSPNAAGVPDTLLAGSADQVFVDASDVVDDSTVLARDVRSPQAYLVRIAGGRARVDSLPYDASFVAIAPGRTRLAWYAFARSQLTVGAFPPGARQQQIASGGVEPIWLSDTTLLFRSGVTWRLARLDARTGELAGAPVPWGRDTRFLDTPGWSNRPSRDGGVLYARSAEAGDARYLRFIPDFPRRMRAAVEAADP